MPRIKGVGELDWNVFFPGRTNDYFKKLDLGAGECNLEFFLDTDDPRATGDCCEIVAYDRKGKNFVSESGYGWVYEDETVSLPALIREMARFFAKLSWATGAAAYNAGSSAGPSRSHFFFRVGVDVENGIPGGIWYPTKFLQSLVHKINRWVQVNHLSFTGYQMVRDPEVLEKGERIGFAGWCNDETVERIILRLIRITGQRVEWDRSTHTIYSLGDQKKVREAVLDL